MLIGRRRPEYREVVEGRPDELDARRDAVRRPPGRDRHDRAIVQHVEVMGQDPPIFRVGLLPVDREILVRHVLIGPQGRKRIGRADEKVMRLHHRCEVLVHGVLRLPGPCHVVGGKPARRLGRRDRIVRHPRLVVLQVPQRLAAEVHRVVPGECRLVAFGRPAEVDFLDGAAEGTEDVQRRQRRLADFPVDGHVAEVHRPCDPHAPDGCKGVGDVDLVAERTVVAGVGSRNDILHQGGIGDGACERPAMVVGIEIRRRAVRVAPLRRLIADEAAAACGDPNGAADVGARRQRRGSGRQRCRRSARGAAGTVLRVERIEGATPKLRVA